MRNPNFRFRGLWAKQLGGGVSSASALLYKGQQDYGPGSFTFTAPFNMIAEVFVWGGGASGSQGGPGGGGPGGGTAMRRWQLAAGQQLTVSVGAGGVCAGAGRVAGQLSWVSAPDGSSISGDGGSAANVGGVGTGGEYNRSGGAGNAAGQNGGAPGTIGASGSAGGGGGAGGFSDLFTSPAALAGGRGGDGSPSNGAGAGAGFSPGGGGGGGFNANGGKGGDGKVSVVILQLV
jgi:hypothetical protein